MSTEERGGLSITKQSSYYTWLEIPLGVTIYLASCTAKILLWLHLSFSPADWKALLIINTVECLAWVIWTLARHGRHIGIALLPFPVIFAGYTSISIGVLVAGVNVYPFTNSAIRTGMLLQSLMVTHLWAYIALLISRETGLAFRDHILGWIDNLKVSSGGIFLFMCSGVIIAVLYLIHFYSSGAYKLVSSHSANREDVLEAFGANRTWILSAAFVVWLMVHLLLWLSKEARQKIKLPQILIGSVAVLIFFSAYLRLGNRRELAHVLLLGATLLCMKGRTRLVGAITAVAVVLGLSVGLNRSYAGSGSQGIKYDLLRDQASFYRNLFSEAIFPNFPLLDHIEERKPALLGATYFRFPGYMSPTFGLWQKTPSLSEEFSRDFSNGQMGFAYTPLGEGYDNFGNLAALVTPFMLVFGEWFLLRIASTTFCRTVTLLPALVFLSSVMDTVRGESAAIVTGLILYCLLAIGFLWLCRLGATRDL